MQFRLQLKICSLRKGRSQTKTLNFIVAIIVSLVVGYLIGTFWLNHSDPVIPTKVTESPGPDRPAVKIEGQGKLIGSVSLPQNNGHNLPGTYSEGDNTLGQNTPLKTPSVTLYDGDKLSIPVQGELKSKYINSQTGQQIGEGSHRVTGETILSVTGNELQAETTFDNNLSIAVEVQKPPPKLDRIGLYVLVPGWSLGGYYQRNIRLSNNLLLFGRIEADKETRFMGGIEYQF